MSTIDSKPIVAEMLRNDGIYPGDPQANSIYQYINDWGKLTFAVYWPGMNNDINDSPHVNYPILLWSKNEGLTEFAETMLAGGYYEKPKNRRQRFYLEQAQTEAYRLQQENELLRSTIVMLQYKLALKDSVVTFPEIDDEHCVISGFTKYLK